LFESSILVARMDFLATELRPPRAASDDALLRLAAETGASGIHCGAGCDLSVVEPIAKAAARLGLEIGSLTAPLPERPLPRGRRLPRLAARERDERAAAIALAEKALTVGAGAGAHRFVVDFGGVALESARPEALARAFARREMDEDEAGAKVLAAALAERRARAGDVTDACLWALERLVRLAEPLGLGLVLPVGATPWEAPTPREARALAETFAGAVGLAWDPGRLSVLAALGLPISDERLKALAASAVLSIENDAVGLDAGYLPGLGERDGRVAALAPAAGTPRVVRGTADATDAEVAAAVAGVRAG
jgi:hypothetical protein